jgi:hypothetical protein
MFAPHFPGFSNGVHFYKPNGVWPRGLGHGLAYPAFPNDFMVTDLAFSCDGQLHAVGRFNRILLEPSLAANAASAPSDSYAVWAEGAWRPSGLAVTWATKVTAGRRCTYAADGKLWGAGPPGTPPPGTTPAAALAGTAPGVGNTLFIAGEAPSSATVAKTVVVDLSCEVEVEPLIYIDVTQEATLLQLHNMTTNTTLYFNKRIQVDETVVIDLRAPFYGVYSSKYGRQEHTLLAGSMLSGFKLTPGRNELLVSVLRSNNTPAAGSIEVCYRPRYLTADVASQESCPGSC